MIYYTVTTLRINNCILCWPFFQLDIAYLADADINYINIEWFPVAQTAIEMERGIIIAGKQAGYCNSLIRVTSD